MEVSKLILCFSFVVLFSKGVLCGSPYEECLSCQNNGTCAYVKEKPVCVCNQDTTGRLCNISCSGKCGSGQCLLYKGVPMCICTDGYIREECVMNCEQRPCQNNGTCTKTPDGVTCACPSGTTGYYCEHEVKNQIQCPTTAIFQQRCFNDSETSNINIMCNHFLTGSECEIFNCVFNSSVCYNEGFCMPQNVTNLPDGYCACPKHMTGIQCNEPVSECNKLPCGNGGSCMELDDGFSCLCSENFTGIYCETELGLCERNKCQNKSTNGKCDTECNSPMCNYDGLECTLGTNPWSDCPNVNYCFEVYKNTECNSNCSTESCLFDGFDCVFTNISEICAINNCHLQHDDMVCNTTCEEYCYLDGLDCKSDKNTSEPLGVFAVELSGSEFHSPLLGWVLSSFLRSVVYSKRNTNGSEIKIINDNNNTITYFQLPKCSNNTNEKCWSDIHLAVNGIAAAYRESGYTSLYTILRINACLSGFYGAMCDIPCSQGCLNECKQETGECLCKKGFAGFLCDKKCPENCADTCDSSTLECTSGCLPGYKGINCSDVCEKGSFGINCTRTCNNCKDNMCDSTNGNCLYGCSSRYYGENCEECNSGIYGGNCENNCGNCYNGEPCDSQQGTCKNGCSAGYKGDLCLEECGVSTFGENCKNTCSYCLESVCNSVTGVCTLGCTTGETNAKCPKTGAQDNEQVGQDEGISGGALAGIIVLVVFIILALGVAYYLWKKAQSAKYDLKYGRQNSEMQDIEQPVDLAGGDNSKLALLKRDVNAEVSEKVNNETAIRNSDSRNSNQEKSLEEDNKTKSQNLSRDSKTTSVYSPNTEEETGPGEVYIGGTPRSRSMKQSNVNNENRLSTSSSSRSSTKSADDTKEKSEDENDIDNRNQEENQSREKMKEDKEEVEHDEKKDKGKDENEKDGDEKDDGNEKDEGSDSFF